MAASDPNLLRILISTDNHLGVWEKDEDRKHDSFRTFEEVLQLARAQDVDMLLLGGDLFHDNKPSRATLIRAVELLSRYCLGDRPVQWRVLNANQADVFVSGLANYLHPHLNVGLPVLTIHGNHDDPSGSDNSSAVDLLSATGLLNYFGKVLLGGNSIGKIQLTPVLIQKGATSLALYGLGNVRDERLGRLFQTPGCVQWVRPAPTPDIDTEDWLNVFVLHQNRVQHGANAKNCLQERHLPGWLDLVVWGHEHECIGGLQELQQADPSASHRVSVLQPGSSVATALSEGEAKPKQATLLELSCDKWRTVQLPLATVRPFVFDGVALAAAQPPLDPEDSDAITAHLERKVNAMIQQAYRSAGTKPPPPPPTQAAPAPSQRGSRAAGRSGGSAATGTSAAAAAAAAQQQQQAAGGGRAGNRGVMLPLVRLRVDYSGFTTINSQRFGQKYVGKVANPHDMLLWAKAPARRARAAGEGAAGDEDALAAAAGGLGLSSLRPEALDQARIEDLVAANLTAKLDILHPEEMAAALHQFVEKDERTALAECVTHVLQETQVEALSRPGGHASTLADTQDAAGEGAADGVGGATPAGPLKEEDIAEVINLSVQRRVATKRQAGTSSAATGRTHSRMTAAAAAGGGDAMDIDAAAAADDARSNDGGSRGKPGSMPPPAPKARGRKQPAASASAGGLRQAGLAESFMRASQQGPTSPHGKTGSNLNAAAAAAAAAGGGGGGTPSQGTSSRSRAAAGSAARGRGRGRGGGRGRGRGAAQQHQELVSSDDDEAVGGAEVAEGISDDDDDGGSDGAAAAARPAKRARVTTPSRPKRAAAAKRKASYAEDEDEDGGGGGPNGGGLMDSDDDDFDAAAEAAVAAAAAAAAAAGGGSRGRSKGGGAGRRGAAGAAAASESIDTPTASLAESIEDSDDEAAAAPARRGGGRQQRSGSQARQQQQQQQHGSGRHTARGSSQQTTQPQQTPSGLVAGPQSVDGGFIDSGSEDEGGGGGRTAAAAGRPAPSAGGGRRRVLPSSLA